MCGNKDRALMRESELGEQGLAWVLWVAIPCGLLLLVTWIGGAL